MNGLQRKLEQLRVARKKALVVYLTAGDPDIDTSVEAAVAAVKAGADVLEIGVPFSDPTADGPVIQGAMERARAHGDGFSIALEVVRKVRARCDAPIIVFGYLNPFLWEGLQANFRDVAAAGADGVLIVDGPEEEAGPIRAAAAKENLSWIPLVAPTTSIERVGTVVAAADGFVYLVSMRGVTGGALKNTNDLVPLIAAVRRATSAPVFVGFGVRDRSSAASACAHADGVIVGSAAIQILQTGLVPFRNFIEELRQGADDASSVNYCNS